MELTKLLQCMLAAAFFSASTTALRIGIENGDARYPVAAFAALSVGYLFYIQVLAASMISAVILVSMLSQIATVAIALTYFQEELSPNKVYGILFAVCATAAFSLPTGALK